MKYFSAKKCSEDTRMNDEDYKAPSQDEILTAFDNNRKGTTVSEKCYEWCISAYTKLLIFMIKASL